MAEWLELAAGDGHRFQAYVARPAGPPRGAIVLLQEIYGVNAHIRSVADRYAQEGYQVIAPALFDRVDRGVELPYDAEGSKRGYALMGQLKDETTLLDIAAAYAAAKHTGRGVAVVGFCYGGRMSWLAATRGEYTKMRPDCCVGYYPGGIGSLAGEIPECPVMLHFGGADSHIGKEQIEAVRSAHPEVEIFVYKGAEHAFNRDVGQSYQPEAAKLAGERTLAFLKTHIA